VWAKFRDREFVSRFVSGTWRDETAPEEWAGKVVPARPEEGGAQLQAMKHGCVLAVLPGRGAAFFDGGRWIAGKSLRECVEASLARLRDVLDVGVPTATELLDPITPQYVADLICWSAIGARTTESQTHRQMASGLSMPVGFKNTTPGGVAPAVHAIEAARAAHTFFGISGDGVASAVTTTGNRDCHVVLRGGDAGPNYSAEHVADALRQLQQADLEQAVLIDCSHGNSGKDPARQGEVLRSVLDQRAGGAVAIIGAMLESNLLAGNQPFPKSPETLVHGQSITDGCIDWATTEQLVLEAADRC